MEVYESNTPELPLTPSLEEDDEAEVDNETIPTLSARTSTTTTSISDATTSTPITTNLKRRAQAKAIESHRNGEADVRLNDDNPLSPQNSVHSNPNQRQKEFDIPDLESPKETFEDTDNSDFEILPDDELDDRGTDHDERQQVSSVSGDEVDSLHGDDAQSLEHPEQQQVFQRESYESPPSSPKPGGQTSPYESNLSPKSRQRRFMDRFTMSPKLSSDKSLAKGAHDSRNEKEDKNKRKNGNNELKSPIPAFKAMRLKAAAVMASGPSEELMELPLGEEDFSSDEEFSDDDMDSIGDDSYLFEDDMDQNIDISTLSHLPTSFLDLPPDVYDYLDSDMVKNIGEQDISIFAWEHHLLVKSLLQLLTERDHIGVEDDVHEMSNILKMGPLKKRYAQIWFVKFVEVRKGNLSFYDDSTKDGSKGRRTVHLRKRTCTCQAVPTKDSSSSGFVFELTVEGGPKRLWMAKSEEERQAWIRAINQAMIGENDDALDVPLDLAPYKNAIEVYESVQSSLKEVENRHDYLVAVDTLLYRKQSSSALRLPLNWIREHVIRDNKEEEATKTSFAAQRHVRSTISDFWENLCNTSVVINGYYVEAKSVYSAERVIGAVSRCILEFDKVENKEEMNGTVNAVKHAKDDERMSELEAVSYGRSIIRSILRSKSRGDAMTAVEELVRNDLVSCVRVGESEPIHIDVSFAGDDFSDYESSPNDISGWISMRTKKNKSWKERYFVISEGVLSFFEKAVPRPSRLRGQIVLADAKLKILDGDIIALQTKETEIRLRFESRGDFVRWKANLERTTEALEDLETNTEATEDTTNTARLPNATRHKKKGSIIGVVGNSTEATEDTTNSVRLSNATRHKKKGSIVGVVGNRVGAVGNKKLKEASEAGKRAMKAMKEARNAGMKQIKNAKRNAKEIISSRVRGNSSRNDKSSHGTPRHRPTTEMLYTSTRALQTELNLEQKNEKREPSVQVFVEHNSTFKVVARTGKDEEDALLVVRVKVFQAFLLSGGSNGRLAKGDEVLEMEFMEGDDLEEVDHEFLEPPTVL